MEYKYCKGDNFEDFSSGRVLYHKAGITNFPVRLAQEIYGRCLSYLQNRQEICIYDACCGGGYLLTVLGFLNRNTIKTIIGSDIDMEAIRTAEQNLGLLDEKGMHSRINEIKALFEKFGKNSHLDALKSANRLLDIIRLNPSNMEYSIFQADILSKHTLDNQDFKVDIVMTDVPYGNLVSWQGAEKDMLNVLLDNLRPVLKSDSVVAICSDKKQKIGTGNYIRLEKQIIGKRKFEILRCV